MNIISFFNAGSAAKLVKVDERELNDMRGQIAAINRVQAVIEFGLDGTVLNANQNFLDLLGYSLEEVKGRHHSIFVDPNYRASQEYRLFWDRLGRGQFETGQYKRIGKGGKEVWIQASYNPILTADGRPFKVVKFATDITDEAQRKIKAERELQQIVGAMDSTSSNVMVADPDRKIIYMNRAVEKMLRAVEADLRKALPHFLVDKVVGSNIDIFHKNPSHQMQLLANLRDTYTSEITVAGIVFRLIVNPIYSENDERLGTVVEWIDRTKEVAAEHEMRRILGALDSTSSNVMVADPNRVVMYMNKAVEKMLRAVEPDLRKALPHFSVDKVIGSNIDIFHRNPSHQMQLLANLRDTYTSQITVAGITFRLIVNPIFSESGDRLGTVVEWIDRTQEVAAEHEMSRILGALETTTTNMMIADPDRKIIYMNKSVESMLRVAEADIRSVLPHFSVDKIVGSNMDIFHKNPAHQMKLLENLTSTYTSNIVVGKRHFRLVANPIFSKDGSRLGSVVEWQDRTLEVGVEVEVNALVGAAAAGNFSERISVVGKEGFFLKLAEGLNSLVTTADKGLNDVARVLGAVAKGDLTERIDAEYSGTFGDLKNYCNETTASLTNMLGDIRSAADMIFTASSEIAQGNADLSSRTEQQAASLEETASSMEELTSTVKLNADNAKQANVLAEQASAVAIDGGTLIQQVVTTMNAINESARKISDIIGVIDGIAFQTNILALNAAVEAARAGDQGRGFAVVASEVRTLAQRSANAAKDIKALISDSVQKIESGNQLVGKSGDTMKEIVSSIKRVNDIMAEIAAASVEQSTGIEEVSTTVSQMDEMTQQNAALVEEAAAAAESLQSQADQLNRNVAQFHLDKDQALPSVTQRAVATKPRVKPALNEPTKAPTKKAPGAAKKLTPPSSSAEDEWEQF
ncbi:MAG TPA: methyl-accepting chemotaxis protein [Cellvibrio sp.]|nr:methyl-accepting chemotaxis protein [Cellvibrio sp.]